MTTASTGEPLKEINCSVKCKTYYPRERHSNPPVKCAFTIQPCDASSKDSNFKTPSPTENNIRRNTTHNTFVFPKARKEYSVISRGLLNVHTAPSCSDCSAIKSGRPHTSMEPGSRQAQHLGGHQHPARSQAQGKLRHHAMYTLSDNFHLKDDVR